MSKKQKRRKIKVVTKGVIIKGSLLYLLKGGNLFKHFLGRGENLFNFKEEKLITGYTM
jgi:hypothetical protein